MHDTQTTEYPMPKYRKRKWLWAILALFVILALGAVLVSYLVTFSPDRDRYPIRGIDVSHHQKKIDWKRVAADDVRFAILKATEGGDHVDRLFAKNLAEARAAGLAVGAYHFYRFCKSGAEQARNFLAAVPRDPALLPPVVDIEFSGNCPDRPTVDQVRAELAAFLALVEPAFGKQAIIYIIGEAEQVYGAALPDRPRWVRSLFQHPGNEDWAYWQYHNKGRVDGIEGDVDLNVLQGGDQALEELTTTPRGGVVSSGSNAQPDDS